MFDRHHCTREAISRFLILRDAPRAVDLAFVFGSPSISNVLPAIQLYLTGLTRRLLITGQGPTRDSDPEWQLYRNRAIADGVDDKAILIEPHATNTLENVTFGAALVAKSIGWEHVKTVALCAKPIHMRRVLMTTRAVFPESVTLVALPPDAPGDLSEHNWWTTPHGRQRVLEELGRVSTYALKGDIGDI